MRGAKPARWGYGPLIVACLVGWASSIGCGDDGDSEDTGRWRPGTAGGPGGQAATGASGGLASGTGGTVPGPGDLASGSGGQASGMGGFAPGSGGQASGEGSAPGSGGLAPAAGGFGGLAGGATGDDCLSCHDAAWLQERGIPGF